MSLKLDGIRNDWRRSGEVVLRHKTGWERRFTDVHVAGTHLNPHPSGKRRVASFVSVKRHPGKGDGGHAPGAYWTSVTLPFTNVTFRSL